MFCPKPYAGSVIQPQSYPLLLFAGNLQAFLPQDPFNPFVVDQPAIIPQHGSYHPVSVPAILACNFNDRFWQPVFVFRRPGLVSLS
jgi:hypothetical protein